ncbi:MAG: hypothetical protein ILM98_14115 [Kiritimatiellae bacterium]|nr:hypothetical protein [Kiritimatiellia bacterium]
MATKKKADGAPPRHQKTKKDATASGQQQGAGKPKAEKKPQTLEELLKPANAYERAIAEHIRARRDEAIEAAIVQHQRSIKDCLKYIAGEARKRAKGSNCVVMADDEVFGLAAHFFLDGDTPSGVEAGAGVDASATTPGKAKDGGGPRAPEASGRQPKARKAPKEEKKPAKKESKKAKADESQMFFGFFEETMDAPGKEEKAE